MPSKKYSQTAAEEMFRALEADYEKMDQLAPADVLVPFPPLSISPVDVPAVPAVPPPKKQKPDEAAAAAAAVKDREATVVKEVEAHYILVAPIFNVALHNFHLWLHGSILDGEDEWSKEIVGHPEYVAKKV